MTPTIARLDEGTPLIPGARRTVATDGWPITVDPDQYWTVG